MSRSVLNATNAALTEAALPPRLSITGDWPVLDRLPRNAREEQLVTQAVAPHLPLLLELLGP